MTGPSDPDPSSLDRLADRVSWPAADQALLRRAMAHRSWCSENAGEDSNERLEFLGDAVLGLVVTAHIFRTYPQLPEGDLAKLRASVVNAVVLAAVAGELGIGEALLLGKGEAATGGREKGSILADAMEAVIGAVYLEGGWAAAEALVLDLLGERISVSAVGPGGHDFKTQLQELAARRFDQLPVYRLAESGPDHAKVFRAVVSLVGVERGTGEGRSKKQAEQAAARIAWETVMAELGEAGSGEAELGEAGSGEAGSGGNEAEADGGGRASARA